MTCQTSAPDILVRQLLVPHLVDWDANFCSHNVPILQSITQPQRLEAERGCVANLAEIIPEAMIKELAESAHRSFVACGGSINDMIDHLDCSVASRTMVACLKNSGLKIFVTKLVMGSEAPMDEVLLVYRAYTHALQMLHLTSYLAVYFIDAKPLPLIHQKDDDGMPTLCVDPGFANLVQRLHEVCQLWPSVLSPLDAAPVKMRLAIPLEPLTNTADYITKRLLPITQQHLIAQYMGLMQVHVTSLKSKCPLWSHLITHSKYNSSLAKKHLLHEGTRAAITSEFSILNSFVTSVVAMMEQINPSQDNEVDPNFAEAQEALNQCKDAMKIISAVSLVEVRHAEPDAPALAKRLLKEKIFPESLRVRIKAIAEKR